MAIFTKSGTQFTIFLNGRPHTVNPSHPNYERIKQNLANDKVLAGLIDVPASVAKYTGNTVKIVNGEVLYRDKPVHNVVSERILEFVQENLPFVGMVKFLENLYLNPSKRAVEELFGFLEHKNLPVDENGCFLCYKAVQSDWYSITGGKLTLLQGKTNSSGQIYNAPGETIECERREVCDNKDKHCSEGLHAGAMEYVQNFGGGGGKIVVVRVNPRDVVSVPADHDCMKIRVCKYEVVMEYVELLSKPLYNSTNNPVPVAPQSFVSDEDLDDDYRHEDDFEEDDVYYDSVSNQDEDDEDERFVPKTVQPVQPTKPVKAKSVDLGKKPDGSAFWNRRDSSGKFKKK
jgi:hypothetical protein